MHGDHLLYSAKMAAIKILLHTNYDFLVLFFTQLYIVFIFVWLINVYWIWGSIIYLYILSFKCSFKGFIVRWVIIWSCHLGFSFRFDCWQLQNYFPCTLYILIYLTFLSSGCMLEHSMSYFMLWIILKHIWKQTSGLPDFFIREPQRNYSVKEYHWIYLLYSLTAGSTYFYLHSTRN